MLNSRQYIGGGRKIKESAELRTAEAGGCVCLAEAERIAYYNKTNNRKIREWIGRTEKPKKQRVSLTKLVLVLALSFSLGTHAVF